MTQHSSFSLFGSSDSTSAMSNTGSAGSFVFSSSAIKNSSACDSRRKHRVAKKGCKCHISPPLHTSDSIAPVSAEQAPANPFEAKSDTDHRLSSRRVPDRKQYGMRLLNKRDSQGTRIREHTQSSALGFSQAVSNSPLPLTMVTRILNGIPHNPHFYQLRNYSELTRKNLISAWDHIFKETVEEIHSLQAMDFWVRAKRIWETIEELQNLGYNVIALRKRLVELSDIMMELKLSKFEIKSLKKKAENHRMEKCRLESLTVSLQAMAKREEISVDSKLIEAAKLEDDLPKFDSIFTKLAIEPL